MTSLLTVIPELTSPCLELPFKSVPLGVGEGQVLRSKTRERFFITGHLKRHDITHVAAINAYRKGNYDSSSSNVVQIRLWILIIY
jgi:hypothetical protein